MFYHTKGNKTNYNTHILICIHSIYICTTHKNECTNTPRRFTIIHTCNYAYIHIHNYKPIFTYVCANMCVHIYKIHTCEFMHIHVCTHKDTCVPYTTQTHKYTCEHIYIEYLYIYTHVHICGHKNTWYFICSYLYTSIQIVIYTRFCVCMHSYIYTYPCTHNTHACMWACILYMCASTSG